MGLSKGGLYGEGAIAHRISVGVSRRGELRGLLIGISLAGPIPERRR